MDKGDKVTKESFSEAMGEVQPPNGLPPNIKCLTITFDIINGNCQVAGDVNNKALCYGMMEAAKDIIQEFNAKRQTISDKNVG